MRLAVVPLIERPAPHLGEGIVESVPDLPSGVRWGRATGELEGRGRAVVWLDITTGQAATLAARGAGFDVRERHVPAAETARMLRALRDEGPPPAGSAWPARDEFVAAYREAAKAFEEAERRRRIASALGQLAVLVGVAAASWLAERAGVLEEFSGLSLGLVVLHTDSFNRADAYINGSTMSDGAGTWSADPSGVRIVGNILRGVGTGFNYGYDSAMSSVDVQRTTILLKGDAGAPTTRHASGNNCYGGWCRTGSGMWIYRVTGGSSFSSLGSTGTLPSAGDTIALDSSGSSHTLIRNGSTVVGPATDSTFASGRGGVWVNLAADTLDDWQVEIDGGGGGGSGQPFALRVSGIPHVRLPGHRRV